MRKEIPGFDNTFCFLILTFNIVPDNLLIIFILTYLEECFWPISPNHSFNISQGGRKKNLRLDSGWYVKDKDSGNKCKGVTVWDCIGYAIFLVINCRRLYSCPHGKYPRGPYYWCPHGNYTWNHNPILMVITQGTTTAVFMVIIYKDCIIVLMMIVYRDCSALLMVNAYRNYFVHMVIIYICALFMRIISWGIYLFSKTLFKKKL